MYKDQEMLDGERDIQVNNFKLLKPSMHILPSKHDEKT